jgi:hypothetical protein
MSSSTCPHCASIDIGDVFRDDGDEPDEMVCLDCGSVWIKGGRKNSDTRRRKRPSSDSGVVTATGVTAGGLQPVVAPLPTTKETKMPEQSSLADEAFFANVLYYGLPKSGKTTAAASVAKLGPIEYIDAEAGLKAQALLQFDIPVANIHPNRDITMEALDALFWKFNENPPTALVWDSISESHKKLLALTAQRRYERSVAKGEKVWEQYAIELGDYGVNTNEMRTLSRQFRDLPCHTAFVALEKREQDEKTGLVSYGPDMTAKLASDILGYVDVICHTYTRVVAGSDEPEYWGAFRTFDLYVGGDRFNTLPPRLINPSMDRIIAYLTHELELENDPEMQAAFARAGGKSDVEEPKDDGDKAEALLKNAGLKPTPTEVGAPTTSNSARRRPPKPAIASKS